MKIAEAVLLFALTLTLAAGARAQNESVQPFVGASVLDPRYDVSALKRTMALSVAVQGVRQGATIALSFESAAALDGTYLVSSSMAFQDAAQRSRSAHYINGTLAAIGLALRLTGGGITFGAQVLSTALTGFSFPFLAGAALDGVAVAVALDARIRLRRVRLDLGVTGVGELARSCRLSEWTHLIFAVLSTFSAVSQTLVGLTGTDLAVFERHRERQAGRTALRSLAIVPMGAGIGVVGRFW